ncbi:hydrolase [Acetobacter orientalis]|uniref:Hydrolase n=1 Tax=Acetobacter orientalis TaxID=146474 RepID=A0A2Z5ZJJ7_9PROT|nr:hydrolase [Acetobacter orientalis]
MKFQINPLILKSIFKTHLKIHAPQNLVWRLCYRVAKLM